MEENKIRKSARHTALLVSEFLVLAAKDQTQDELLETVAFLIGILISPTPHKGEVADEVVEKNASLVYDYLQDKFFKDDQAQEIDQGKKEEGESR